MKSGPPTTRIDGAAKVMGRAAYTADFNDDALLFAVAVDSTIALGQIESINVKLARATKGVVKIFTHENAPKLSKAIMFPLGASGQKLPPLQNDQVNYYGQTVALVIATSFEAAQEAAALVKPKYSKVKAPHCTLADAPAKRVAYKSLIGKLISEDGKRGNESEAFQKSDLKLDLTYSTPRQFAMAMEPHATVASWDADDNLTVREGSQWVDGAQKVFADWFDIKPEKVRLLSNFVGGGFGSKVMVFPHAALAAMAARELKRPVKLVLDRTQVIRMVGGRPATEQQVKIGANRNGKINSLLHNTTSETSPDSLFVEAGSRASRGVYDIENYTAHNSVAELDITPPVWMRAPGDAPGSFALESAMDELAVLANIDPVELRLKNYAEKDPDSGKPWSTRELRKAYSQGAATIQWSRRKATPRSLKDGDEWIGLGMATALFSSRRSPSEAFISIGQDGRARLESRGVDIGTGSFTAMAIVVSESLGLPIEKIDVHMGQTDYARSAFAGGSMMTASLGAAVKGAADDVVAKLIAVAQNLDHSPFAKISKEAIQVSAGALIAQDHAQKSSTEIRMTYGEILKAAGLKTIDAKHRTNPSPQSHILGGRAFNTMAGVTGSVSKGQSVHSWGAHFVEVGVHDVTGIIRVRKMVGVFDCGRVLNPITAHSQLMGGMIMGLGMALFEGADVDRRYGKVANGDFENYIVPVHADTPEIDISFVGDFDPAAGPLGTKPMGELGIVGSAAAIANAVYNAIGVRSRALPIKLE